MRDAGLGSPHTIPTRIEIGSFRPALLLDNQAVALCSQGIDFENITAAPVMIGIDQNLEVIVQALAHIASQFRRYDAGWRGIVAMNPKIGRVPGVEDTHLGLFGGRFTFLRLSLPKISNGLGGLPERIVECTVQARRSVYPNCLSHAGPFLRAGLTRKSMSASRSWRDDNKNDERPK